MPTLISESGRAIASHQLILIFDVVSTCDVPSGSPEPSQDGEPAIIHHLWETYQSISLGNYQEAYHNAVQFKDEALSRFNLGILHLTERAKAEDPDSTENKT